jgi:hypothetical protein
MCTQLHYQRDIAKERSTDTTEFGIPCLALTDKMCSDKLVQREHIVALEFGNMGRCVLLFRTLEDAARASFSLKHEFIIELDAPGLVLDWEKGQGSRHVAIDFARTEDGQTAVSFRSLDELYGKAVRVLADCHQHRHGSHFPAKRPVPPS